MVIVVELVGEESSALSMLYELLDILFVDCVHDVEEVGPVGKPTFAQPVWEVPHELRLLLGRGP